MENEKEMCEKQIYFSTINRINNIVDVLQDKIRFITDISEPKECTKVLDSERETQLLNELVKLEKRLDYIVREIVT